MLDCSVVHRTLPLDQRTRRGSDHCGIQCAVLPDDYIVVDSDLLRFGTRSSPVDRLTTQLG